jgi:thermolabile hemolysin
MPRFLPHRSLPVACALFFVGCGFGLHEPAPDFAPGAVRTPWRIHCETAMTYADGADKPSWPHGRRWIWASDSTGRPFLLDGEVEDGFVLVHGIRLEENGQDAGPAGLPATAAGVREACRLTLEQRKPPVAHELGKVRGAREGEDLNAPLLFPDDPAAPPGVKRMVVFGDSLSDTGKLRQRLHVFPRPPYWMGRFSNGPIWTDYFEWQSGIAIQHHAYGGASAAQHHHGGEDSLLAMIRSGGQIFLTGSIDVQVRDYLAHNLVGGDVHARDETAFLIWAGANDYVWKEPFTGSIGTFLNSPKSAAGYERVVDETVAALVGAVEMLHARGGRRFLLVNLPDLGRTPIVLQNRTYFPVPPAATEQARKIALSYRLTELTRLHNRRLADEVAELRTRLPDSEILLLDSARSLDRMLDRKAPGQADTTFDYGFDLEAQMKTIADAGHERRVPSRCYEGGYTGTSHSDKVCARPGRAVFWDVLHPSSLSHCWQSFAITAALARAGWVSPPPSPAEQRDLCVSVVDRYGSDSISVGLGESRVRTARPATVDSPLP